MIKGFKHFSSHFFGYLGGVIMTVLLLVFIFIVNNYHYFIYALIIAAVVFTVRKIPEKSWKEKGKYFLILAGLIYISLLISFSVSPFLTYTEFRWTHPGWKTAEADVISYQSEWEKPRRKSSGYAYSDVSYHYQVGTRNFTHKEHRVEKLFYPIWESKSRIQTLKYNLLQRTKQRVSERKFTVLYNAETPAESKLFISRQLFYPQGSGLYAFAILIGTIFFLVLSSALLTMKK